MHNILVSHESPIQLLEESLSYNDYQYCLVHLMEENEAYREWYLNVSKRFGQEVLLDNSIFELGESFDSEKYVYWIKKLNPNFYIVPDVLEDYHGTMNKWISFTEKYDNAEFAVGHEVVPLRIGVVQGKTWDDLVKCYRFMCLRADYIAISFDYSYFHITGYGDNPLDRLCSGRQRFISQLIAEGEWRWDKPVHLLGCSLAREFRYYVDKVVYNIRSCDTSNPVVAGIKGLRYNSDLGLTTKPSVKLADMINVDVDVDMKETVMYNTKMFKSILRRSQPVLRGGCGRH